MHTLKIFVIVGLIVIVSMGSGFMQKTFTQDRLGQILLDRGLLWDLWTGTSHGTSANYAWFDGHFEYPGFEPGLIKALNFGSRASHMEASNWSYTALRSPGIYPGSEPHPDNDVQGWHNHIENIYAAFELKATDSVSTWIQPVSNYRWKSGENYYLRVDPLEAEEVIDAKWQWNPYYRWSTTTLERDRHFLPIKVDLSLRLWTGSRQDQLYQVEEIKITNISDHPAFDNYTGDNITLYDFFVMHNYYTTNNRRSWGLLGGWGGTSKDEAYYWDQERNMMVIWDDDWKVAESPQDDVYDFIAGRGPTNQGEWAASGYIGIGFLYATPNKYGIETKTHNFWNAACEIPGSGTSNPYQGTTQWNIIVEGYRTLLALGDTPRDKKYGDVIFDSHITIGPWDIAPGESINVVSFQGIGGVNLEIAMNLDKMATKADIATGRDSLYYLWDRAQLTTRMALKKDYATGGSKYKGWNMPDPPGCPYDFTITPYLGDDPKIGTGIPGNVITWGDWADDKADPDYEGDEAKDLESYTVWKGEYVPIMGWRPLINIKKKDANYYTAGTKTYKYVDTNVKIGWSYFYALSAADKGHTTWPPRPEALTEYPRLFPNGKVPPLQSNLQASLNYHFSKAKWTAFRTLRTPGTSLSKVRVFPNPFIMRAGFINPGDQDGIHFANIPAKCKIYVYSIRGDLVASGPGTIQIEQVGQLAGFTSGEAIWKQLSSSEQFVESGIYFYVIEALDGPDKGKTAEGKFVIIR